MAELLNILNDAQAALDHGDLHKAEALLGEVEAGGVDPASTSQCRQIVARMMAMTAARSQGLAAAIRGSGRAARRPQPADLRPLRPPPDRRDCIAADASFLNRFGRGPYLIGAQQFTSH